VALAGNSKFVAFESTKPFPLTLFPVSVRKGLSAIFSSLFKCKLSTNSMKLTALVVFALCLIAMASPAFAFSQGIIVENLNATNSINPLSTLVITLDTASLISIGKLSADCGNLQIFYNHTVEIARNVSACGSAAARVSWSAQEIIPPSSNSTNYTLRYGEEAATLTDPFYVWLAVPPELRGSVVMAQFFEEAAVSQINDSSPYGNNGTEVSSGGKSKVDGLFGEAVNFTDGENKEYFVPYTTSLYTGSANFGFAFWFAPNSANSYMQFVDWRHGAFEHGGILTLSPTNKLSFNLNGAGDGSIQCDSNTPLLNFTWYQIVAVGNESACTIYINGRNDVGATGTAQGTGISIFSDGIGGRGLHIGGRYDAELYYSYRGTLDNFFWFNSSPTSSQISQMYNSPPTPPTYLGAEVGLAAENMHVTNRTDTFITFEWDNPLEAQWISLSVVEEATTIRSTITTRDNWTAPALKWNTLYNFTHQTGDTYGFIGSYITSLVKTNGWYNDYISVLGYKRLVTVNDVVSADLDNYLVNVSLDENNFDFSKLGDSVNGSDFRAVNYLDTEKLAFNVTYINVSGSGGQLLQTVPDAVLCVGNWMDCNKTYDTDYNTFGSPQVEEAATVYFNYTIPSGTKLAKWTVKDGDNWGWQIALPASCYSGGVMALRAVSDYNTTSVNWSCQNSTDDTWLSIRAENTSYHVYYTEAVFLFKADAYILVNLSHLDANYSSSFYIYYGGNLTSNSTSLVGFAGIWQNVTLGDEIPFIAPNVELSNIQIVAINDTAVNVKWDSSLTADSRVKYSLNEWFIGEDWSGYSNYTDEPEVNISALATDTTWYFMGVSCDASRLSNCGNITGNLTLGSLPSMPTLSIINYTENRSAKTVTVCVNLTDTDSQTINLSLQYFYVGTSYEVFNESSAVNGLVAPSVRCFEVPVEYGKTYFYRGKAAGGSSTGYSSAYTNEFRATETCFAGNPVTDDDQNRVRECSGFREGSCQSETSMWIETNATGSGNLRLKWWDGSSWSWHDMSSTADMWYIKMDGLGQSWYTFEIWNATAMLINWTKPSLDHPLVGNVNMERKYVSFGCTPSLINYTLLYLDTQPYYNAVYRHCIASGGNVYECMMAEYYGGGRESGLPASLTGYEWEMGDMFRGGITDGESYDTGVLNSVRGAHRSDRNFVMLPDDYALPAYELPDIIHADTIPKGTDQYRYCFAFLNFWWNETKIPANGINNYYVRYWHSDDWFSTYFWKPQEFRFDFVALFKWQYDAVSATRDFSAVPSTKSLVRNDVLTVNASVFNSTYDESLSVYQKSFPEISLDGSDSEIYDFGFQLDGMWVNVMTGEHQQAFVIFNLPDNVTLNATDTDHDNLTDFDELYVYYTNPFSADTDEGGLDDGYELSTGRNPNIWTDDYVPPLPPVPEPPVTVTTLLSGAGTGLGSFLTSITQPLVGIVLGLGVVFAILGIVYGLFAGFKMALNPKIGEAS
jgi:hypothetical protein